MGSERRTQFEELNRAFMSELISNLRSVGSDCCLAPLATSYIGECSNLMKALRPGQDPGHLSDLGQRLKGIGDQFMAMAEGYVEKAPPLTPPRSAILTSPPVVTKEETRQENVVVPVPQPGIRNSFRFGGFGGAQPQPAPNHHASEESTPAEGGDEEEQEKEAQAHEFVPITEEDALFSIRCKIFHQVKGQYEVRGLGQLYIQNTENGSHRMLIRADNSLGNILLNMKITPDIPMTLNLEKKQILTIDPHKPCPITILVKTPDLAQTLYNEIEKCRSS